MKKQLLTLALLAVAGTAGAQQLPNGSFDEGIWVDCVPWTSNGNKKTQGRQPPSWTISNVIGTGFAGKTTVGKEITGRQGTAVQVENTPNSLMASEIVPGYFTLGKTWSTSVYTSDKDGGTFGGISFKYKPDALKFYYKRSCSGSNVRSSVIAYLWNGQTTQTNVPGNITTGLPTTKTTMIDRDVNLLSKPFEKGDKKFTNTSKIIAKIEAYTTETPSDWTEWIIPFDYTKENVDEVPEKFNVIFAASDYFNSTNVTKGVKLCIDDVSLVYYKHLKSLTIDGTTPSTFVGDDTQNNTNEVNIDASDKYYTEGCISALAAGAGAKVNESYNSSTHVCTLKVTAGDGEVKNYNIQFGVPCTGKLSSLTVNGTAVELVADKYYYVVTGDHTTNSVSYVKEDGDKATAAESYDADKHIFTIKVTAPGAEYHTYYVKFAKTGDKYMSNLFIGSTFIGGLLAHPQQNVEIVKGDKENTIDLQLRDFKLGEYDAPLGDIFVYGIPCNPVNGSATLHKELTKDDNFRIFGDAGSTFVLPNLVLDGDLTNGKLNVALTITWDMTGEGDENSYAPILVKVYSPSATSVDLSDANFARAGAKISKILSSFKGSPIVYLPEGEDVKTVSNVVVGTTASSLSLTDGNDWGVTKDFTAAAVSYDHVFKKDANYVQSFVLPFGFTVPAGTTVAELSSVNGDNLVFKPVTETVANKPYLVVTNDGEFINKLENVQVKATTGADLTTTVDGVSHIGSYTAQNVANVYGYAKGKFVKANTGSVKPFRTYVKVAGDQQAAPMAFGVNIEGTVTGINNATAAATAKEAIYNLQGVRVSGDLKHLTKGVYIVNGQKVVVK